VIDYKINKDGAFLATVAGTVTTYSDPIVAEGVYVYAVIAVYQNGDSEPVEIRVDTTSETDLVANYDKNTLIGNYPNPFNPETIIKFVLVKESHVSLEIYNVKGVRVKSLAHNSMPTGVHRVVWNGTDDKGNTVGSGVYFYRLKTESSLSTKRMMLIK
jgi:hypothetical protein